MGGLRASEWVITLVFFLYSNYARHFTRLRHTLKGVVLCCFSLLCIADIGWKFCRMLHCCGLFFSSGQFKSCFPHQTKTLEKSRVFAIFGPPKMGFECNYECNWSRLTLILAAIGWDYFFIFKNIFSCLIFSTVYPTHTQSLPLWSNCRVPCLNCRISIFQMTKVFDIISS